MWLTSSVVALWYTKHHLVKVPVFPVVCVLLSCRLLMWMHLTSHCPLMPHSHHCAYILSNTSTDFAEGQSRLWLSCSVMGHAVSLSTLIKICPLCIVLLYPLQDFPGYCLHITFVCANNTSFTWWPCERLHAADVIIHMATMTYLSYEFHSTPTHSSWCFNFNKELWCFALFANWRKLKVKLVFWVLGVIIIIIMLNFHPQKV